MCQASDMVMGVAFAICDADAVHTRVVPGAYSHAQSVGKAILSAKDSGADVMDELQKVTECREFFRGRLTRFSADSRGGWDFGAVHIDGIGKDSGKKFRIDYQNESLVAWEDEKVIMTTPDLICAIDLNTGDPLSNADFREGMDILALGIPVHKNWFLSDRGLSCWQYHFDTIGYKGGVVRY
jgi:DUF917 family protein